MNKFWTVPEKWPRATAVCIGGGPSLTQEQVDACRGRAQIIAINDAYRMAPWADLLYFCDDKWWLRHRAALAEWDRPIVRMGGPMRHDFGDPRIRVLRNYGPEGLSAKRDGVFHGRNSGYQAIQLAVHLGAARVLLLGYDMRAVVEGGATKTHWFGDHPEITAPSVYEHDMLPLFPALARGLRNRGIEVLNCTPGSALAVFPASTIEQALAGQ